MLGGRTALEFSAHLQPVQHWNWAASLIPSSIEIQRTLARRPAFELSASLHLVSIRIRNVVPRRASQFSALAPRPAFEFIETLHLVQHSNSAQACPTWSIRIQRNLASPITCKVVGYMSNEQHFGVSRATGARVTPKLVEVGGIQKGQDGRVGRTLPSLTCSGAWWQNQQFYGRHCHRQ